MAAIRRDLPVLHAREEGCSFAETPGPVPPATCESGSPASMLRENADERRVPTCVASQCKQLESSVHHAGRSHLCLRVELPTRHRVPVTIPTYLASSQSQLSGRRLSIRRRLYDAGEAVILKRDEPATAYCRYEIHARSNPLLTTSTGAPAAFADVAGAGGAHLGSAVHAEG